MVSFRAMEDWLIQMSNSIDSRVIVMVLGNKCDLPNREVPYNVAMEWARSKNFGFLEVSAKTGTNIKNAFNCIVRCKYYFINQLFIFRDIQKSSLIRRIDDE